MSSTITTTTTAITTAPTTLTMSPSPMLNGRTDKSSKKQTKVIILNIHPSKLKKFLPKQEPSLVASSPIAEPEEMPIIKSNTSQEPSESAATPGPTQENATADDLLKKKGPTPGTKRSTPMPSDGAMSKPRGKPGPKKKPRLEDGTIDHSVKPTVTTANHKLGPKANTGFINANLRALDRTGTPCRRWQKRGLQLKSFTGIAWEVATWKGGEKSLADYKAERSSQDISAQDSSEQKASETDTAKGSNTGDHLDKMEISTPTAGSPPRVHQQPIPAQA